MGRAMTVSRRRFLALITAGVLPAVATAACGTTAAPVPSIPTLTLAPLPVALATIAPTPTVVPSLTATLVPATPAIPTDPEGFADPAFRRLWDTSDRDIAAGKVSRTWLWGPKPFAVRREPFAQSPGGVRLVQYFDKSRMEINDPNGNRAEAWFVTNGLLTTEMVAGRVQVGLAAFEALEPADVPIAGDLESPDPSTPRYADFTPIASLNGTNRARAQPGAPVVTRIARGGATGPIDKAPVAVKLASFEETLGHNIPDVFVNYFSALNAMGLNWVFVTGYPISEPYWVSARIGGQVQVLLVQLFERRALTYNPRNKDGWQIEFANIGLHYYRWRFHNR